jgi:hypothetical protein
VVVAIALTLGIERLLPSLTSSSNVVRTGSLPLLVALVVTAIPFYHGALRHLDVVYVEQRDVRPRPFAVLVDFFLLFMESCVILALAASTTRPGYFAVFYATLLLVDVLWAIVATTVLVEGSSLKTQNAWLIINLCTLAGLASILVPLWVADAASDSALRAVLLCFALGRTTADYARSWRFYAAID